MKLNDLGRDVDCMACLANMTMGATHGSRKTHTHENITHALSFISSVYSPLYIRTCELIWIEREKRWAYEFTEFIKC